jgi:hypothetical protein
MRAITSTHITAKTAKMWDSYNIIKILKAACNAIAPQAARVV